MHGGKPIEEDTRQWKKDIIKIISKKEEARKILSMPRSILGYNGARNSKYDEGYGMRRVQASASLGKLTRWCTTFFMDHILLV